MIVVNTETIPGWKIVELKGLVQGNTVRAKNVGRDIAASFKNLVGGELKGYTELLVESRREAENARYSFASVLAITIAGGILGGIFAVPAIFMHGSDSWIGIFMLVVFGPFAEETLKQSGMIFQLEKLPGSVWNSWQFFLSGALGGLVFSILENLLYQYVYLAKLPPDKLTIVMGFRWVACTLLHIFCTQISALGLRRVGGKAGKRGCRSRSRRLSPGSLPRWVSTAATISPPCRGNNRIPARYHAFIRIIFPECPGIPNRAGF